MFDVNKLVVTELLKEKNVQIFIKVTLSASTSREDVTKYEILISLFSQSTEP